VYDPRRVFGVTMLDVIRSKTFVGELKGINPDDLDVTVVGGHSGNTILPLLSQQQVEFSDAELDALVPKIQNAGTEVVEAKAGGGSATLSMADAGARFTVALARGLAGDMNVECCYVAVDGEETDYFAQPVRLGPNGVEEILSYGDLSEREQGLKAAMIDELKGNIAKGIAFVND
ncbi:MAG: malate dehydrogenase, partial [Gammaproteobacteria bacterium]